MSKKATVFGAIAAIALAFIVGLATGRYRPSSSGEPPDNTPVRVGVVLSMTGDVGAYGERSRKGVMLAMKRINEEGGIAGRPLEVVLEDAKSVETDGVAAFKKLTSIDGVDLVIGDVLSSTTLAIAPIAEREKILLLAPGASNPALRDAGDFIFRNWASDDYDGKAIAAYAYNQAGVKEFATLAQRTDYCLGLVRAFESELKHLGGSLVLSETFTTDAIDFRAVLTKISASKPTAVFLSAESRQTGTILRQARELGLDVQWFTNLTVDTPEAAILAGTARNGVVFSTPAFDPGSKKPEVVRFVRDFRAEYGEEPEAASGHAYDAVLLLADALRRHGFSSEAARDGLYSIRQFPGVTGVTTFDEEGDVVKNVFIKTFAEDKVHLLEEYEFQHD